MRLRVCVSVCAGVYVRVRPRTSIRFCMFVSAHPNVLRSYGLSEIKMRRAESHVIINTASYFEARKCEKSKLSKKNKYKYRDSRTLYRSGLLPAVSYVWHHIYCWHLDKVPTCLKKLWIRSDDLPSRNSSQMSYKLSCWKVTINRAGGQTNWRFSTREKQFFKTPTHKYTCVHFKNSIVRREQSLYFPDNCVNIIAWKIRSSRKPAQRTHVLTRTILTRIDDLRGIWAVVRLPQSSAFVHDMAHACVIGDVVLRLEIRR